MSSRQYSAGVTGALTHLCGGACYAPDCRQPVVQWEGDTPVFNLEKAHIRALNPGGPRYDPEMREEDRNAVANLILLCDFHHKLIDKVAPDRYSVDLLNEWKAEREANGHPQWAEIQPLTEAGLQQLIKSEMEQQERRIEDALERFRAYDSTAAAQLEELIDRLSFLTSRGPLVDPDVADMLSDAVHQMRLMSLPDTASILSGIASDLGHLPDTADQLNAAAENLRRAASSMEGYM